MIFSGNPSGAGPVPFPRAAADRDPFRSLAVSDCARSALARAINARWASQVRHRVDLGLDSDARLRELPIGSSPAGFQKRFSDRRRVRQSKRTAQISLRQFCEASTWKSVSWEMTSPRSTGELLYALEKAKKCGRLRAARRDGTESQTHSRTDSTSPHGLIRAVSRRARRRSRRRRRPRRPGTRESPPSTRCPGTRGRLRASR